MANAQDGSLQQVGYFAGMDRKCFEKAAALSQEVNIAKFENH